ncbi:MAG: hypothetical protein H6712_11850 [Myxococcales bacterium]|nr:hypothetical protein [Myxococcales bacterium]MCB9714548.1 hypothetical protein [Myxococcales bacterium]
MTIEPREPIDELRRPATAFTDSSGFLPPEKIRIYDDSLRDGEQMPGVAFSPAQKLELAKLLDQIGCHVLDVAFPRTSEQECESLRLILEARRRGELSADLDILVMSRADRAELDFLVELVESYGFAPSDLSVLVLGALSDIHVKYKLGNLLYRREHGRDPSEQEWLDAPVDFYRAANITMMTEMVSHARECGFRTVEYAGEDASRAHLEYVLEWGRAGKAAGGTRMCFSDTVGILTPEAVDHYFPPLVAALDGLELTAHFHNDYGQAASNTVRALSHGASHAGVTVNGIGERAGNASLHQVAMILKDQYGVVLPGFRYDLLRRLRRTFEVASGVPLAPTEPIVGDFVFSHESGIHVAGIAIHPEIYQTIEPSHLDTELRFIFGKHTGRNAVRDVLYRNRAELERRGVQFDEELATEVTEEIKAWRNSQLREYSAEIDRHYKHLRGLGMGERAVVDLAVSLSVPATAKGA